MYNIIVRRRINPPVDLKKKPTTPNSQYRTRPPARDTHTPLLIFRVFGVRVFSLAACMCTYIVLYGFMCTHTHTHITYFA